ncbi:hypothetical protein [Saccharospirillum impatiens]|uniref:hypothetical protein n=1 Tax=Saccharospirillum impatiens TaxID=169438 RepID=UPI00048FD828|nr:hypothetical protein [Saccharospirillum impatiens]
MSDVRLPLVLLSAILVLAACGQREINVDYNPNAQAPSDWYPIPVEEPRTVTNGNRLVNRPPVTIDDSLFERSGTTDLIITDNTDSFGNVSLQVNRSASLTWELLEGAVVQLGWPVADRNRSQYRLELEDADVASRNLFGRIGAFFSGERQTVYLILVPRVSGTGIAAEYPDDRVLSAEENRELMNQLRDALLQGRAQTSGQPADQE